MVVRLQRPVGRRFQLRRPSKIKIPIKDRRAAESSTWKKGIAWNVADAHPAEPLIKTGGITVRNAVEHEKQLAGLAGGRLGCLHQGRTQSASTCPSMDEHLRHVGSVRLVLRLIKQHLYGATDPLSVFSDDQRSSSGFNVVAYSPPKRCGPIVRQRLHEADRSAAVYAVDQDADQRINMFTFELVQTPY